MGRTNLLVALIGSALTGPLLAAPSVDVTFTQPDAYTDIGPRNERDATLAELRHIIERLAPRYLRDSDRLSVDVIDVDLAGQAELTRSAVRDLRVQRDGYPPRMTLRYTLVRDGQQSSGEDRLTDIAYLADKLRCRGNEPLCYEARMLAEWLARIAKSTSQ